MKDSSLLSARAPGATLPGPPSSLRGGSSRPTSTMISFLLRWTYTFLKDLDTFPVLPTCVQSRKDQVDAMALWSLGYPGN